MPYRIDYGKLSYSYSEEGKFGGNSNFWDYYFLQDKPTDHRVEVLNSKFENYPLKIWNRDFIKTLHREAFSEIKLQPRLQEEIDRIRARFQNYKIMGIHVRKTDHHQEVRPVEDSRYFQLVQKHISRYDKLFIATDDQQILTRFEELYKDKVIAHPFYRSEGSEALHEDLQNSNGYELGRQALLDCYSLASCGKVILSPSNLSYTALLINPDLNYHLAESREATYNRWKTQLVYLLDKWGIRKW